MLGDGVVELYEAGVVDNSRKGIDKGKFVFNFVMGSKRLYDSTQIGRASCRERV